MIVQSKLEKLNVPTVSGLGALIGEASARSSAAVIAASENSATVATRRRAKESGDMIPPVAPNSRAAARLPLASATASVVLMELRLLLSNHSCAPADKRDSWLIQAVNHE